MTPGGASLQIAGLVKEYRGVGGPVLAVDGVDLEASGGELVAVIGPSGCGKSTVFNVVAGLEEADAGHVWIGGEQHRDRLGHSAYMPQQDALLDWRRVVDNVTLPLEVRGVRRSHARRRALPLLERFGLSEFVGAWPWQLSGGMRQRVAFLRTVIDEPALMLLDEPFGALDGITRADLQQWLGTVWAEFESTIVLVTHDIGEAVFLADRVFVMSPRPGRIVAEVPVSLPRPRVSAVRESDDFLHLERVVRRALHAAMLGSGELAR